MQPVKKEPYLFRAIIVPRGRGISKSEQIVLEAIATLLQGFVEASIIGVTPQRISAILVKNSLTEVVAMRAAETSRYPILRII